MCVCVCVCVCVCLSVCLSVCVCVCVWSTRCARTMIRHRTGSIQTTTLSNEQQDRYTIQLNHQFTYGNVKTFTISMWVYVTEIVQYDSQYYSGQCFFYYQMTMNMHFLVCTERNSLGLGWFKYYLFGSNPVPQAPIVTYI